MRKIKRKNQYYAIKVGRGCKDLIVNSWDECQPYIQEYNSIFRSFSTKERAVAWLRSWSDEAIKKRLEKQKYYSEKGRKEYMENLDKKIEEQKQKENKVLDSKEKIITLYDILNLFNFRNCYKNEDGENVYDTFIVRVHLTDEIREDKNWFEFGLNECYLDMYDDVSKPEDLKMIFNEKLLNKKVSYIEQNRDNKNYLDVFLEK